MNQHHCEGKFKSYVCKGEGACFYFKKYDKMSSKNCKKLCFADWLLENSIDDGACPESNITKIIEQSTKAFNLKNEVYAELCETSTDSVYAIKLSDEIMRILLVRGHQYKRQRLWKLSYDDFAKVLEMFCALDISNFCNDDYELFLTSYDYLMESYAFLGNEFGIHKDCLYYLEKVLKKIHRHDLHNKFHVLRAISECHIGTFNYENALKSLLLAKIICPSVERVTFNAWCVINQIGFCYMKLNQFSKALEFLKGQTASLDMDDPIQR